MKPSTKLPVVLSLAVVCLVGMISCRKEPPPAPAVAPPAKPVSISEHPEAGEAAPPVVNAAPAGTPDTLATKPDHAAAALMLTKGLKDYVSARGKFPLNLEEIKAAGFIQTIPDPPPGMHWDFDRNKTEVIAAGYAVGL